MRTIIVWLAVFVTPGMLLSAACSSSNDTSNPPPPTGMAGSSASGSAGAAGSSAAEAELFTQCVACIQRPDKPGPGCGDELQACYQASPKCKPTFDCVVANHCYRSPTQKDFIACAQPCAQQAGVVSQDDPEIPKGIAIEACRHQHCPVCDPKQ